MVVATLWFCKDVELSRGIVDPNERGVSSLDCVFVSLQADDSVAACNPLVGSVNKFLDRIVPRSVIAGLADRYASIVAGMDTIKRVESLANPASTLTRLATTGISLSQSVNNSAESSPGFTSSSMRILKSSLGYSGSCDMDFIEDGGDVSRLKGLMSFASDSSDEEMLPARELDI